MKFNRATAFEKHLIQANKEHLAPVYLLAISDAYERRRIAEQVAMRIQAFCPNSLCILRQSSQMNINAFIEELNALSLFEKNRIITYEYIQSLKSEEMESLIHYFANPAKDTYVLLGISHSKLAQEIYMRGKKDLISYDLTEEKPWDRKDRWVSYLKQFALSRGKKCSLSLIERLLEKKGMDLAFLERDMEKIITFVGERTEIQLQDLEAICRDQRTISPWQLLDCILFAKRKVVIDAEIDTSYLLVLLSQMRIQLQHGLEIRILLEKRIPSIEIFKRFPMLKKNQYEKLYSFAQKQDKRWFIQALHHLFHTEMLAKNSSATPAVLLHVLSARLSNF